jgi:hypothetical protein
MSSNCSESPRAITLPEKLYRFAKMAALAFCLISTIYFWKKDDLEQFEKNFSYIAVSNTR